MDLLSNDHRVSDAASLFRQYLSVQPCKKPTHHPSSVKLTVKRLELASSKLVSAENTVLTCKQRIAQLQDQLQHPPLVHQLRPSWPYPRPGRQLSLRERPTTPLWIRNGKGLWRWRATMNAADGLRPLEIGEHCPRFHSNFRSVRRGCAC